jgi:hypothetical protein
MTPHSQTEHSHLDEARIGVMDLPARSHDPNSIEHLWDIPYRHVTTMDHHPQTIQETEKYSHGTMEGNCTSSHHPEVYLEHEQ